MENEPRIGDVVKVISAKAGATGANGQYGTITDKPSNHGVSFGIRIELENGEIWAIGHFSQVKLELIEANEKDIEFPEQNKHKVRVGDSLYLERGSDLIRIETVTKVTRTLIRSENYTYRIEDLKVKGQDTWYYIRALQSSPEVRLRWENQKAKEWIRNHWHEIPVEIIKEIKIRMENE